jgi:hypothetical protein
MKELTSQYSKWLSNFEFWLELVWLGEKCKGKTLLAIEIFFTLRVCADTALSQPSIGAQYPKQNMIKFSLCLAELAEKFTFL